MGFPGGSADKLSTFSAGGLASIPGLGRSPGEGNSYPPQYSGLENSLHFLTLPKTVYSSGSKKLPPLNRFHLYCMYCMYIIQSSE